MVEMKDIWMNGETYCWPNAALRIRLLKLFQKLVGKNFTVDDLYLSTQTYIDPFKPDLKKIGPDLALPGFSTSLFNHDFKYYKFVGGEIDLYGRQPNFWYTKPIVEKIYIIWEI